MVFYRAGLGWGDLPAAQVQTAIDLARVGGDDFAAEVVRQTNAKLALSGGIGSKNDEKVLHPQWERWSLLAPANDFAHQRGESTSCSGMSPSEASHFKAPLCHASHIGPLYPFSP